MYYENEGTETQLYDNTGVPYGQGVFTIQINPPVTANAIIIRKTGIMTLCEVEIYGGESTQYHTKILYAAIPKMLAPKPTKAGLFHSIS